MTFFPTGFSSTVFSLIEARGSYIFNIPVTRATIGDRALIGDFALIFSMLQ